MKKLIFFIFASFLINVCSYGQGCIAGTAQFNTAMNNYQANFLTDGDMFWNFATKKPATFIPKNSQISPIFAASVWMGGYVDNAIRVACMTYRRNGIDFWPGPVDTATTKADTSICNSFDKFFPIYKTQVDSQINNLYTAATMPANILSWPGNGLSLDTTSHKLAPYADVNLNGIYDPLNGDYPIMMGDYSVYQIFNDIGNKHSETGSIRDFGLEVHLTNYMLNCPSDSALWNTMFMHYEIINRATDTVNNFMFAMFSDFNLGNPYDDYIGCDTNLNMYYAYNGDGYDGDTIASPHYNFNNYDTINGYHQNLPAMAGLFLNQKMSKFIYYNDEGSSLSGNPVGYALYYNLMNGLWQQGGPMTYGDGGMTTGGVPCTYIFPGDPVTNTGWTEMNGGTHPNNNMESLGSCGPYTFMPHDTLKIDFAYVFARDYQDSGNYLAPITKLRQSVQSIQNYYNANVTPCGSFFDSFQKQPNNNILSNQLLVYPNPTTNNITVSSSQLIANSNIQVVDLLGNQVMQTSAQQGKASIDISNLQQGIYFVKTTQGTSKFIKQ